MNPNSKNLLDNIIKQYNDVIIEDVLIQAFNKFIELYKTETLINSNAKYPLIFKVFRSVVVSDKNGNLKNCDFLVPYDSDEFSNNSEYRDHILDQCNWKIDSEILFDDIIPPKKFKANLPLLNSNFTTLKSEISVYIKYFEYLLYNRTKSDSLYNKLYENIDVLNVLPKKIFKTDNQKLISDDLNIKLQSFIMSYIEFDAKENFELFKTHLNQDILNTMKLVKINDFAGYNWLNGNHRFGNKNEYSKKRIQAVNAYPLFFIFFLNNNIAINTAIEKGYPLIPVLADYMKIEDKIVKRSNQISPEILGFKYALNEEEIGETILSLGYLKDISSFPKTPNGWQVFFNVIEILKRMETHLYIPNSEKNRLIKSLDNKLDDISLERITLIGNHIVDMVKDLRINIFIPAAIQKKVPQVFEVDIFIKIFGNKSFLGVIQAAEYWATNQERINRDLSVDFPLKDKFNIDIKQWLPLNFNKKTKEKMEEDKRIENWDILYEKFKIVPLINEVMLQDEHRRMRHCVNTYVSQCLFGQSHIFSLRNLQDRSLVTFEINENKLFQGIKNNKTLNGCYFKDPIDIITQKQGYGNSTPEEEYNVIIFQFIEDLLSEKIKIDVYAIQSYKKAYAAQFKMLNLNKNNDAYMLRYQPSDESLNEAWQLYKPLFPKSIYKLGIENKALYSNFINTIEVFQEKRENHLNEKTTLYNFKKLN